MYRQAVRHFQDRFLFSGVADAEKEIYMRFLNARSSWGIVLGGLVSSFLIDPVPHLHHLLTDWNALKSDEKETKSRIVAFFNKALNLPQSISKSASSEPKSDKKPNGDNNELWDANMRYLLISSPISYEHAKRVGGVDLAISLLKYQKRWDNGTLDFFNKITRVPDAAHAAIEKGAIELILTNVDRMGESEVKDKKVPEKVGSIVRSMGNLLQTESGAVRLSRIPELYYILDRLHTSYPTKTGLILASYMSNPKLRNELKVQDPDTYDKYHSLSKKLNENKANFGMLSTVYFNDMASNNWDMTQVWNYNYQRADSKYLTKATQVVFGAALAGWSYSAYRNKLPLNTRTAAVVGFKTLITTTINYAMLKLFIFQQREIPKALEKADNMSGEAKLGAISLANVQFLGLQAWMFFRFPFAASSYLISKSVLYLYNPFYFDKLRY